MRAQKQLKQFEVALNEHQKSDLSLSESRLIIEDLCEAVEEGKSTPGNPLYHCHFTYFETGPMKFKEVKARA